MTIYIDKKALCSTPLKNFCEIQGIGNDPMYMRPGSVQSIIGRYIPKDMQDFLAVPEYSAEDDAIVWFAPNWIDTPRRITDLYGEEKEKYYRIYRDTLNVYNDVKRKLHGESLGILDSALKFVNENFLFCYDNKVVLVAWGMNLRDSVYDAKGSIVFNFSQTKGYTIIFDPGEGAELANPNDRIIRRKEKAELVTADVPRLICKPGFHFIDWKPQVQGTIVTSDIVFHAQYQKDPQTSSVAEEPVVSNVQDLSVMHTIRFVTDGSCQLDGMEQLQVEDGYELTESDFPEMIPLEGFCDPYWNPAYIGSVHSDLTFKAKASRKSCTVTFLPGKYGELKGVSTFAVPCGTRIKQEQIPQVVSFSGYTFAGWDNTPLNYNVANDSSFQAQYRQIPWLTRFWMWFTNFGCLKWLLLLLALLLLTWLVSWLFRGCNGNRWNHYDHDVVVTDKDQYHIEESTGKIHYLRSDNGQDANYIFPQDTTLEYSEIRDEVQEHGGNTNAFLRFSIIWNQQGGDVVDLDAHAIQPDREEIYYQSHMNNPTSMSGVLDVDDIRPHGIGVENIIWTDPLKMADGTYTLFIRNYDGGRNHGAKAEVAFNGKTWHYTINQPIRKGTDIPIAQIKITNNNQNFSIRHSKYLDRTE